MLLKTSLQLLTILYCKFIAALPFEKQAYW